MEQNNLEQTINKLKALNKTFGVTNKLTQVVIHPNSKETNIKFLISSESSGAEFICNVEDALQVQALLAKLIEKTKQIRFYEL